MTNLFKIILLITFFCISANGFAQSEFDQIGGRALGVSGASVTYRDMWSQYHNQAGLAYLKGIKIGVGYKNEFQVKELSTKAVATAIPIKSGTFGINYAYFGYPKYNENKVGLAFARQLGKRIAAGIQIDYLYTHIDGDYGQRGSAIGEIGLLAEPLDNLLIGAHLNNVWYTELSENNNELIPVIFSLGASYQLYKVALLSIEFEKDIELSPIFKTGLEFELIKKLKFRTGISTNPNLYSFGIGYEYLGFDLNIAFSKHPVLGYSTSLSIIYSFKDRL